MKVYKFRSLGDTTSWERARRILETGEFWCSSLWEQNDPMEGIYLYLGGDDIFDEKNRFGICSFSGELALGSPTMWGYYANGFRGIAIEIEVEEECLAKVRYSSRVPKFDGRAVRDVGVTIEKIVTSKLTKWRNENEYRYLNRKGAGYAKLGEITSIYFGLPYHNIVNLGQILAVSPQLREYLDVRGRLIEMSKKLGYDCFDVQLMRRMQRWDIGISKI